MVKKKLLDLAAQQISEDKYQERVLKVRIINSLQWQNSICIHLGGANGSNFGKQVGSPSKKVLRNLL